MSRGPSDEDLFEARVVEITAQALAENRLRLWDKRLLLIYALILLTGVVLFVVLDRQFEEFRTKADANCRNINAGNTRVNAALEEAAQLDPGLRRFKLPLNECPPG